MTEPIHKLVDGLSSSGLTVTLLGALDYIVPGQWENVTSFQKMVENATGETDQALIQKVGERAILLYNSEPNYARAVSIFQLVDSESTGAGAAALAHEWVGFLEKVTPKPDTTQAIDATVKLVAELTCFCLTSGIPGDSVGDFVASLGNYEKEDSMRLAAFLAFDCVLPFGPDFLEVILDGVKKVSDDELGGHGLFQRIAEHLPGNGLAEKRALVQQNIEASADTLSNFVSTKGVTRESVLDKIRGYLEVADDKLDVVAAAIDLSCDYFEHTGIQTVARKLASRAYGEI